MGVGSWRRGRDDRGGRHGMLQRHLAAAGAPKVGRCRRHGRDVGIRSDEAEILVFVDQGEAL